MNSQNQGRWTRDEQVKFHYALKLNLTWKQIGDYVGTRTSAQCRSHYQKIKQGTSRKNTYSLPQMVDKGTQYEENVISQNIWSNNDCNDSNFQDNFTEDIFLSTWVQD